jgi:hypothetical protein
MTTEQLLRSVPVRADGYLAGKEALAVGGKVSKELFQAIKRNGHLCQTLDALAKLVKIFTISDCPNFSIPALIQTNGHTNGKHMKFFIHPLAFQAIVGMWFPAQNTADIFFQYHRLLTGDRTLVADIIQRADLAQLTTTLVTMSTSKGLKRKEHAKMHEVLSSQHAEHICNKQQTKHDLRVFASVAKKNDNTIHVQSKFIQVVDECWRATAPSDQIPADYMASVYFIRVTSTEMVKVGRSANVNQRISTLQTGCPYELELEMQFQTKNHDKCESQLHKFLKSQGKHVNGEWFKLPADVDHMQLILQACSD